MLHLALNLGTCLGGSGAIAGNVDGKSSLWNKGGELTRASGLRRRLRVPGVVVRDLNLDIAVLLESADAGAVWAGEEGVELGGNVLETSVDGRGALADNVVNQTASVVCRGSVTLDQNVNSGILIVLVKRIILVLLWHLYSCTALFAQLLDRLTLTTDDVCSDRDWHWNLDGLLGSELLGGRLQGIANSLWA